MRGGLSFILAVMFTISFLMWGSAKIVNSIFFDRGCEGYLKRAADANTVELAKDNLATAISWLKERGMTSGYTSVLYRTPAEDVGFWFSNLEASFEELETVDVNASKLEKTNVLMKLRETLLDHGNDSVKVTCPEGISLYPNNAAYMWWGTVSFILMVIFWIIVGVILDP